MKKFTRLTVAAMMATMCLSASAFEIEEVNNLYIVGDAVATGWDRGQAPELSQALDADEMPTGVFSWTGLLTPGEFKFVIGRDSWDSLTANSENAPIVLDAPLRFNLGDPDFKWIVETTGIYNLTVDLNERSLTATLSEEIYIVGGAVASGWDRGSAPALTMTEPYVYSWKGTLNSGDFKFLTSRYSWDSLTAADADLAIELDIPMAVNFGDPDFKWVISEGGAYIVTVDIAERQLTISQDIASFIPTEFEVINTELASTAFAPVNMYGAIYKYIGSIAAGNYKISATDGQTTMWVKDNGDGTFTLVGANEASTFAFAEMEKARLVINSALNTLTVDEFTPWENVWTIGSFGWGFDDDHKFIQDENDADIFAWEGYLSDADGKEIKFTCADNYDAENSIHPYWGNQTLTEADTFYRGGNDNKWLLPESGWYRIVINSYLETIEVVRLADPDPEINGDVDGDGEVAIGDVTALVDIILSGENDPKGDVDTDGEVGIGDVTALVDIILSSN